MEQKGFEKIKKQMIRHENNEERLKRERAINLIQLWMDGLKENKSLQIHKGDRREGDK